MIDCYIPTSLNSNPWGDNGQGIFTLIYKFMKYLETLGITTEVARQGGRTGGAANINFWDEANPFLTNAFFVFKFNANGSRTWPWYLHFQVSMHNGSSANYFGVTPGAPGLINAVQVTGSAYSYGGHQAAIGIGGDADPWNGTGALGVSTKGGRLSGSAGAGPVWTIPSGGTDVLVFPRSNYTGGTHAALKQNYTQGWFATTGNSPSRVHLLADDDNFLMLYDWGDNGAYYAYYYGLYVPMSGVTLTVPFVACSWENTGTNIGPIAGGTPGGGVSAASGGVRTVEQSRLSLFQDEPNLYPNRFIPPNVSQFDIWRNMLTIPEASHLGTVGEIDFWREITNTVPFAMNSARTKVALGSATIPNRKLLIPWDGTTSIRRNYTERLGVTF